MSLINDALKKAQKAHSTDNAPPPPVGQSHSVSHGMGKGQLMKIFLAAVVVLGIFGTSVAFLILGLMGDKEVEPAETQALASSAAPVLSNKEASASQKVVPVSKPEPAITSPKANMVPVPIEPVAAAKPRPAEISQPAAKPTPAPAPKEAPPSSAPVTGFGLVRQTVVRGNENAGLVDDVLDSEPQKTVTPVPASPTPAIAQNRPQAEATPATSTPQAKSAPAQQKEIVKATPMPTASKQTPAAAKDPVIADYVDKLVIQGIRLSGVNSKVLMNNKVFRLNTYVNRDLKLTVISISKERIIFADNVGIRYTKYY